MSNDGEMSDQIRQAEEISRWQRKEYEKKLREQRDESYADLAAFASFLEDLDNGQIDFIEKMITQIGATAEAFKYLGMISGIRVYRRDLMVDGRTFEDALADFAGDAEASFVDELDKLEDKVEPQPEPTKASSFPYGLIVDSDGVARCGACRAPYASIEDAIETINRKGKCPTCIQKEKWG